MTLRPILLAPLVLLATSLPAIAAPPPDALQRFLTSVDTLSARFTQVQKDEQGKVLQESSGKLLLARPGKFRWAYEKPYEQLVVCDGKTLWLYDPDLEQVTVRPAGATLQGTPAQLLSDRAALDKHFKVEDAGADKDGAQRVRLVPKAADSDFKRVEMWFTGGAPQRMRFHDHLGGISDVTFTDIVTNKAIDAKQFGFEPPKGVEVIQAEDR